MGQKTMRFGVEDAFAVYSMPRSNDHTLLWSDDGYTIDKPYQHAAFVIQAFQSYNRHPIILPAHHIIFNGKFKYSTGEDCPEEETSKRDYILAAHETIEAIRRDDFTKVVLSRTKQVDRGSEDIYEIFLELKKKYINAFVFLYHIPGQGCWCGATPEVLLSDKGDRYHTMALAGTQPLLGLPISDVQWGEKEEEEQHIIEYFIEGKLDDKGLYYTKRGPRTVRAAEMLHICTDYYIEKSGDGLDIASFLHPGPAICGLPQGSAQEWIRAHEEHDRLDYCGYIGPWDMPKEEDTDKVVSAVYINLRSMTIWRDSYLLYLGGGLTVRSDPESEWRETELKASTMLAAIHQKYPA